MNNWEESCMKDFNRKIFKNAQVTLEGNLIRCENNSIQISNVSQIWSGRLPKVRIPVNLVVVLLFMAFIGYYFINSTFIVIAALGSVFFLVCNYWIQVEYHGLNLELCSGEIYSFVSKNTVFVNRVYHLINEIIAKNNDLSIYNISFKGNGEIKINPEKLTAEELTEKNSPEDNRDIPNMLNLDRNTEQLYMEINELYIDYRKRDDIDAEILSLIGQTAQQIGTGDKKSLKESYSKFITSGLINNCNELALNFLIEEIKKNVLT